MFAFAKAAPGGSNTQVQFNDGGALGGDDAFTWNKTTHVLKLGTDAVPGAIENHRTTSAQLARIEFDNATYGDGSIKLTSNTTVDAIVVITDGQMFLQGSYDSGEMSFGVVNSSTNEFSDAAFYAVNDASASIEILITSSTYAGGDWGGANEYGAGGTQSFLIGVNNPNSAIHITPNRTDAAYFHSDGTVALGKQVVLATNATTGFTHIPTCAGTPTGVPNPTFTGHVPMVYDLSLIHI